MGIEWLFEIDETPATYFATKATTYDAKTYFGRINPGSFTGLPSIRIKAEMNSHAVSRFTFKVFDNDSDFSTSDFEGKKIIIREIKDTVELQSWRFVIETAEESYREWTITCKDFLSPFLDGVWPNTGLVKDIFPERFVKTQGEYSVNEAACVPIIFGTSYIPLQSVADSGNVYFVLGYGDVLEGLGDCTTDWCDIKGVGWTYDSVNDRYNIDGSQNPSTSYATSGTDYCTAGVTYTVTFTIENMTPGGSGRIILGGGGYGSWRSADGTYTENITCSGINGRVILTANAAFIGGMTDIIVSPAYTITEMTSPHEQDGQTKYTSGITYNQSTISGTRVVIPNEDATSEDMWWRNGTKRLSPLIEFYRSDTSSLTNIIDVIEYILTDPTNGFGLASADLDSTSWAAASTAMGSRSIAFSRGYFIQESRTTILCNLLNLAGATLVIGETLEIYLNVKASVATIDTTDILGPNQVGPGSFKYTKSVPNENDSGNIEFSTASEPENILVYSTVSALGGTSNPTSKTLKVLGVKDTQDAQQIGMLYYQKLLNQLGKVTFTVPYAAIYRVGSIITIYDAGDLYGASKIAEIDSINYNKNSTVDIEGIVRDSTYVLDWDDSIPSAISVENSPSSGDITVYSKSTDYVDGKWNGTDTSIDFEAVINKAIADGVALIGTLGQGINDDLLQDIAITTGGSITIGALGGLDVLSGGSITVAGTGLIDITSSTGITIASGGVLTLGSTGTINVTAGLIQVTSGGDLELQSSADNISMLTFRATQPSPDRYFDFYPDTSGTNLLLRPRQSASSILFGDLTYTYGIGLYAYQSIDIFCGIANAERLQIQMFKGNNQIAVGLYEDNSNAVIYYLDQATFYAGRTGSFVASPTDLGTSAAAGRWGGIYGTTLNISSTATMAAINAAGNIVPTITSNYYLGSLSYRWYLYAASISCTYLTPATDNTYTSGTASYRWSQTHSTYCLLGGQAYDANVRLKIKGSGTSTGTYSISTYDSAATWRFYVNDGGTVWCSGTYTGSSETYKENIKEITEPILSKILKLKPKTYNYKGQMDENAGFTTEDIINVFPNLVKIDKNEVAETVDENGKIIEEAHIDTAIGLNYSGIIPYNTKAIQEHQNYIDALVDRIENLEKLLLT